MLGSPPIVMKAVSGYSLVVGLILDKPFQIVWRIGDKYCPKWHIGGQVLPRHASQRPDVLAPDGHSLDGRRHAEIG